MIISETIQAVIFGSGLTGLFGYLTLRTQKKSEERKQKQIHETEIRKIFYTRKLDKIEETYLYFVHFQELLNQLRVSAFLELQKESPSKETFENAISHLEEPFLKLQKQESWKVGLAYMEDDTDEIKAVMPDVAAIQYHIAEFSNKRQSLKELEVNLTKAIKGLSVILNHIKEEFHFEY